MPGLNQMSSVSSAGASVITLQFDLKLSARHRRAAGPGGDQCRRQPAAGRPAGAADLRQGQSGRRADPDARASPRRPMPLTKVQDLADTRLAQKISQLPGVGLVSIERRPEARRAHPGQPAALAAYGLNIDDLRTTIANANVNTPKGNFDGPTRAYTINANDQITEPPSIQRPRRRLPQRRAGAAARRRRRSIEAPGEQQAGRLDEHDAGGDRQRPAPARRQRHRGGRQHQGAAAAAARRPCRPSSTSPC